MLHFGYFGKTIHSNDLVEYNLPKLFVEVWRDWLEATMAASEYELADKWPVRYRETGRYCFSFSGGIAGNNGWIGIFAPSTDAFGRRYPFCFAMSLPDSVRPYRAFGQCRRWLDAANALLDELMIEDFDLDTLHVEVDRISGAASMQPVDTDCAIVDGAVCADGSLSIRSQRGHEYDGASAMLDVLLTSVYGQYSVWTAPSHTIAPRGHSTAVVAGLPGVDQGIALFDKQWHSRGFTSIDVYGQ